ncbi:MAG: hypothetical protein ACH37Z_00095 [Anaerolineae bacterium]
MAINLVKNIGLSDSATSTQTSSICEPSTAANGKQLMMTGNWFASTSVDAGAHWSFVDPFTTFPASAGGFCCDQLVVFNPRHKIWIWLLQYSASGAGSNLFRLAVCHESSFGQWYYWDFAPTDLNQAWTTMWFDYPDMAYSDGKLFVTFNAFVGNDWQRSFVFRFPLATLAAGTSLGYHWWSTTKNGSIRLCRGAGATMYMGSHNSTKQVRVFGWADTSTTIGINDVNVAGWTGGAYSAPGPGGVNWLGRADSRITGAWLGAGIIGFMWSVNKDTNHPLPFIRVARIAESTKTLVDEPDIWSNLSAWAYPAAAANVKGDVGISAFYGGGAIHPGHVVGVRAASIWDTQLTKVSTHGPAGGAWGDYLTGVPHHSESAQWTASGYTLQGGNARKDVEPRYVQFHN